MSQLTECKSCDNKFYRNSSSHTYCSEACQLRYKSGVLLIGRGRVKKGFTDARSKLKGMLKEIEAQGHQYVTVRFND
jgi:hypothetical protein